MKKSLLALAVLGAFAGVAQAQTAVTIYGSFDGGIRNKTNVNAAGDSQLTMGGNGLYNNNRIGFKGVEDLGGGLNAHFTLETGFNNGTGGLDNTANLLFQRSAFVGLGGAWGSVDLGRQYSINFQTIGAYDPFSYKYTSIIPLAGQGVTSIAGTASGLTRLSNDIKYTGTFGPVTARAEYALGEQAGSTSNASTQAVGLSYAGGPFSVGGAYTQRKNNIAVAPAAANFQNQKNWTVGGAFATGPFRVAIGYADAKQDMGAGVTEFRARDAWVGGTYNFTPAAALTAAFYQTRYSSAGVVPTTSVDGRRNLFIVGGTYALSKRTNFYADIDNAKLSGTAVTVGQDRQTGVSVGINHLF